MSRFQAGTLALFALLVGIVAAMYLPSPKGQEPEYLRLYPQPRALPDFTLVDHDNQPYVKADLEGKWTLMFVGYTHCPDICPTTLSELAQVYPELQQIPGTHPLQIVLMSVDPKRDTPERLNEYINFFHPDFVAVSGEHSHLFPTVRAMGMMYSMSESTDNPDYLVDHSSSVVVINPKAQVIGRFKPDFAPGKLPVSDGTKILADLPFVIQ